VLFCLYQIGLVLIVEFFNVQTYRHVDYIMFENPMVADRFLNYWRRTGNQRIGIMFGRYEPFKDVPLGIKASVAAIYEPPQVNRSC
jgi:nuclear protein localization family protein 4